MIRNVIILDNNSYPLFAKNFGECHSFPSETNTAEILSGFISALYNFSKNLSNQDVSEVNFGNLHLFITTRNDLVVVLAVDDDNKDTNKKKLNIIAELFVNTYTDLITVNQSIDQSLFEKFPEVLLKQGIVQDNCGVHEGCIDYPNNSKSLPAKNLTQTIQNKWN